MPDHSSICIHPCDFCTWLYYRLNTSKTKTLIYSHKKKKKTHPIVIHPVAQIRHHLRIHLILLFTITPHQFLNDLSILIIKHTLNFPCLLPPSWSRLPRPLLWTTQWSPNSFLHLSSFPAQIESPCSQKRDLLKCKWHHFTAQLKALQWLSRCHYTKMYTPYTRSYTENFFCICVCMHQDSR